MTHLPERTEIDPEPVTLAAAPAPAAVQPGNPLQTVECGPMLGAEAIQLAMHLAVSRHGHREGPEIMENQTLEPGLLNKGGSGEMLVIGMTTLEGAVHQQQLQGRGIGHREEQSLPGTTRVERWIEGPLRDPTASWRRQRRLQLNTSNRPRRPGAADLHTSRVSAARGSRMAAQPPEACVARRRLQKQLPSETRRWIEACLQSLERSQRFEDAYALRMELAEWVLDEENGKGQGNLTVEALLQQQHPDQNPLVLG